MRARTREKYEKPFRWYRTLHFRFKSVFCVKKPVRNFPKPVSRGFAMLKSPAFADVAPSKPVAAWVGSEVHTSLLTMRSTTVLVGKQLSINVSGLLSLIDNAIEKGQTDWPAWKREFGDRFLQAAAEIDAQRGLDPVLVGRDLEWAGRRIFADVINPDSKPAAKPLLTLNLGALDGPVSAVVDSETGEKHEQAGLF